MGTAHHSDQRRRHIGMEDPETRCIEIRHQVVGNGLFHTDARRTQQNRRCDTGPILAAGTMQ